MESSMKNGKTEKRANYKATRINNIYKKEIYNANIFKIP
jgi:hypothetical protein